MSTDHAWFANSLRKSHVLYVSPQWATRRGEGFDADALVNGLSERGVDCVELYCKDHHGNVYYPSAHGIPYPRDVVGETVEACRRRGMRFIAYVSICFDEHAGGLHRDWRATDVQGRARVTGPFTWMCLRSPYRDLMLEQIEELARGYDIDGLWMDIIPIAHPSPYTSSAIGHGSRLWMLHDVLPCYCHWCRTQFREETGRSLPLEPSEEDAAAVFAFGVAGNRTFIEEARSILRRHRPAALATYNGAGAPGDAVDVTDVVSIEGHSPWYDRQDLIGRWARGRDRPFEILSAGALPSSPGGWNGLDRKPGAVLRLEAAVAAAHGGSTVFGHAPFTDGHSQDGQFDGLGDAFGWIRAAEPRIAHPRPVADVLLAETIKPLTAARATGRMLEAIEGWTTMLRGQHVQFELGGLDRDLSGFRLVVLAEQLAMSDAEVQAVDRYVRSGGTLLVTGETSRLDERGGRQRELALADLLGVTTSGGSGDSVTYITWLDPWVADGLPTSPIVVNRECLRLIPGDGTPFLRGGPPERPFTDGSTVLWGYPSPDPSRDAVLGVRRDVGTGRVAYVGVPLDHQAPVGGAWGTGDLESAWTKRLSGNLVRALLPDPVLDTDAPAGLEMVLNGHGDYWVLHLIDHQAGDPRYLELGANERTLGTIRVDLDRHRLPVATAERSDGRTIDVTRSRDRVEMVVDGLAIHDFIVLRSEEGHTP